MHTKFILSNHTMASSFTSCSALEPIMSMFESKNKTYTENGITSNKESKEDLGTPRISNCPSKATSIFSIPSRDSLEEFRQDAAQRNLRNSLRSSPLFACTISSPMEFTFDEQDTEDSSSIRKDEPYRHVIHLSPDKDDYLPNKRYSYGRSSNDSTSTASTADNSSVITMRRTMSEGLTGLPEEFATLRE